MIPERHCLPPGCHLPTIKAAHPVLVGAGAISSSKCPLHPEDQALRGLRCHLLSAHKERNPGHHPPTPAWPPPPKKKV